MNPSPSVLKQAALAVAARRRLAPYIFATPAIPARCVADTESRLFLKAENFQRTGSFKFRGALSRLTSLSTDTPIITASSGNHGLALATAAQMTGHKLTVVLPETVARTKLDLISALDVETILHSDDSGLAERYAQDIAREHGKVYVSPYDDAAVIAGQGTIALELLEQVPQLDTVYVSMGGGGLISGVGSVLKAFSPSTRIVGVSAANSAALATGIRSGKIVKICHSDTLADGCAGGVDAGSMTFPLASEIVDDLVDCSEEQIAAGLRTLAWQENMLVEGTAALAFAAYQADNEKAGKVGAVILCGANFDRERIAPLLI